STVYGQSIGVLGLSYSLEIIGPSTNSPISVIVQASGGWGGTKTGAGGYSGEAQFNVSGTNVDIHSLASGDSGGQYTQSFDLNQSYGFQANSVYSVSIGAEGDASVGILGGTASFFANLDPTFTIDPTFADAAEYSVVLSPDVGNSLTSAVPEPSTWAM